MKKKLQSYMNMMNNNTKKSNDIMLKVMWGFWVVFFIIAILAKVGIFDVAIDYVLKCAGVVAAGTISLYIFRKIKISEEILKYYIVILVHFWIFMIASDGRIGIYCLFILPTIISIVYLDRTFIYVSCAISYFVLMATLYCVSGYRVNHLYAVYTREKWFLLFGAGYTLEFICIVLAIYAVASRIDSILKSLYEQNKRVINMQNDVIAGFAGLVESRDNHTGEHVKRTADTVKLIMDSMFENDIYSKELDEKSAKLIEMAAPLHDIGKIKIPDSILCKPAKLTEEEFSKMKFHTSEGKEIIDKYLDGMEEEEFINTARDIVLSHHERWDGAGYPNKLKGEEIPLSARIMAVADVFDALVSKRCYKEAFSFEESFKIIMEGSGTQFDPEIVKALRLKEKELMELYTETTTEEEIKIAEENINK